MVAVVLQFDLFGTRQGFPGSPVIFQGRSVHHQLAIEMNGDLFTDHADVEGIPLAQRFVGQHEGIFAGAFVIPHSAGTLLVAIGELGRVGRVPDLDLWGAPEVNAAVGGGGQDRGAGRAG